MNEERLTRPKKPKQPYKEFVKKPERKEVIETKYPNYSLLITEVDRWVKQNNIERGSVRIYSSYGVLSIKGERLKDKKVFDAEMLEYEHRLSKALNKYEYESKLYLAAIEDYTAKKLAYDLWIAKRNLEKAKQSIVNSKA